MITIGLPNKGATFNLPKAEVFKIMLLDFDGVLTEPTLPIKDDGIQELFWQLSKGCFVCICTGQPYFSQGLEINFFQPVKDWMIAANVDVSLLDNLHLLTSYGTSCFLWDSSSLQYKMNTNYNPISEIEKELWEEFVRIVEKVGLCRSSTHSGQEEFFQWYKYPSQDKLDQSMGRIKALQSFDQDQIDLYQLENAANNELILIIKPKFASKSLGMRYVNEIIKNRSISCLQSEILVMGDRMGVNEDDSHMIIEGACVVSLGRSSAVPCPQEYLNSYHAGGVEFLRRNRLLLS